MSAWVIRVGYLSGVSDPVEGARAAHARRLYPGTYETDPLHGYAHGLVVSLKGTLASFAPIEVQRRFDEFIHDWVAERWKSSFYLNGRRNYEIVPRQDQLYLLTDSDDHVFEVRMFLDGLPLNCEPE